MKNMYERITEINGHAAAIYDCVVAKDMVYSASADHYIVRWWISNGKQDQFAVKFEQTVYSIDIYENYLFAGLANGDLHIFDLKENKEIKFYQQHTKGIFSIQHNVKNKQLYVGDADGNLSIWDLNSLELLIYLPLDCGKIRSIDVSSDGDYFAISGQDGYVRIFETTYFNEIHSFFAHENGATAVLFHPTKKDELFSGGKDALLKQWNWKKEIELKSIVAHMFSIYGIIAQKNGRQIVTCSRDKNIKIWRTEDLTFLQKIEAKTKGHRHSVNSISKIGEDSFVSCSDDKRMFVFQLKAGGL